MSGKLYLCATPIGNLEDITLRVLRTLKEVDLIAAEDTRNSIKLLNHFDIKTPMTSYHEYNKIDKAYVLINKMQEGQNIALITDAGTPGISDPGEELAAMCYEAGIEVTSLPGPAACITALTLSGLPTRRFAFEAFLPADKKERKQILEELKREKEREGFYRNLPEKLENLDALKTFPFTTESELAKNSGRMLLCSQGEVQRVISEQTSGTTGAGKRVFYTERDCEHTIELFMAGLGEFIYPGSTTMVAMPFSGPFGLGELIAEAIRRIGAKPLLTGTGRTYGELKTILEKEQPDTYVGMPVALLSMLRMCGKGSIKRALVSGDACPETVMNAIEKILETQLWPHYGSREMGLGGAICCAAHDGMHMRENHCIMEIIDEKGNVLPDGEWGELVITTIGMEAQPLIRYRTGDCTRIIPGRCICGSEVKRLDFVKRISQPGTIREMDDVLFQIPELVDYSVRITEDKKEITALLTSDKGMESLRNVLTDGDTISLNCRKAEWKDTALYSAKRVILYYTG